MDCFALLDDCAATEAAPSSRLYTRFVREHRCDDPHALDDAWAAAAADMRAGLHAIVLADYEWGARLIRAGDEGIGAGEGGALRFLVFERLQHLSAAAADAWLAAREASAAGAGDREEGPAPAGVLNVRASVDRDGFNDAIERIHAAIRAGETYQVNYTYRLDFDVFGPPVSLYRRLRARQPVGFGAFIALPPAPRGPTHVLSCSPELFLRNTGGTLQARPMKGTASRARVSEGDSEIARMLSEDVKNRAENLMIVDLLRNDLGRIARTGSVRVPRLFAIEPYATLFQMTSTIEAELPDDVGFAGLMRALFPCGSITGAPKHRTMQLISRLESSARGIYTGSIGWIDPPGPSRPGAACGDFCLSVAIRTLTLGDEEPGGLRAGTMGVGAGIVIDSSAGEEYEECALKARFLTGLDPGFELFETMFATREAGIRHLGRHLARLKASADALGFRLDPSAIGRALEVQRTQLAPDGAFRLRLAVHKDGRFDIVVAPLDPLPAGPVRLLLADDPVDAGDPFLCHKTTMRSRYDAAVREAVGKGAFDMLFFDRDGLLTEGARSNVFVRVDGRWLTPPLGAGVLPGVMRGVLLDDPAWNATAAAIPRERLLRAERIVVCNALRGALEATLQAGEGPADD